MSEIPHSHTEYRIAALKAKFKRGDKVKIVAHSNGKEFNCHCGWGIGKDKYVNDGNIYTVQQYSSWGNIYLVEDNLVFPFFCLEKVE